MNFEAPTIVLILIALEVVLGLILATRTRDVLHWQIMAGWWATWKSKTVSVEQEISDLKLVGIFMTSMGIVAGVCILNMEAFVAYLK